MSYYTYGQMPTEIWPATNTPPLSQGQEEQDEEMFGDNEQAFAQGGYAEGGSPLNVLEEGGESPRYMGQVAGAGTGRSDEIDAKLSDGEYVIDAEVVALIGDGSTEAGAAKLDEMVQAIRRHKGKALAKGKFSPDARSPLEYIEDEE